MQAQIQALLAVQGGAGGEAGGSNMGSHMEVAKPAIFNGEAELLLNLTLEDTYEKVTLWYQQSSQD